MCVRGGNIFQCTGFLLLPLKSAVADDFVVESLCVELTPVP